MCLQNVSKVPPLQEAAWQFLRQLNIELLGDPAILLPGVYPRLRNGFKQILAVFTIAKGQSKPCPPTDDQINSVA